MRLAIGGQGHEDDVLAAALFDVAAGGDTARVGVEHDLEQDGWIVGGCAGFIIGVARREVRQIKFVIDDVAECVFESAREDLTREGDGKQFELVVVVFFVAGHPILLDLG